MCDLFLNTHTHLTHLHTSHNPPPPQKKPLSGMDQPQPLQGHLACAPHRAPHPPLAGSHRNRLCRHPQGQASRQQVEAISRHPRLCMAIYILLCSEHCCHYLCHSLPSTGPTRSATGIGQCSSRIVDSPHPAAYLAPNLHPAAACVYANRVEGGVEASQRGGEHSGGGRDSGGCTQSGANSCHGSSGQWDTSKDGATAGV